MKKLKINNNVLALLMLVSIFAGWQYMILMTGFIWLFCEVTEKVKNLAIKVISIYAGCLLFGMLWDIIVNIWELASEGLLTLFKVIGSYADMTEAIYNVQKYFLNPINYIVEYVGLLVSFVILIIKFKFIKSVVTNSPMGGTFSFVQEYINYFTAFANASSYSEETKESKIKKTTHCPNCGEEIPEKAVFCTSCGTKVD